MKVGFGCDHAGFEIKDEIIKHLKEKGFEVVDFGTYSKESIDYADYARPVAEAVAHGEVEKGVLVCGTGIGISLAANKVKGIRAAVCSEPYSAQMAIRHNNANIIAFGARVVGIDMARMIIDAYFDNSFEGGRHENRVKKIMSIEETQ